MPTFIVKARKITPLTTVNIDAETREKAVAETIATAAEGEEVQITSVEEAAPEVAPQEAQPAS